jgi:hypothetical protein
VLNLKVLVLPVLFVISGCMQTRQADRYLIPQGYTGWVFLEYEVKGAPPLGSESGFKLFRIPRNGRLQTSSPGPVAGAARDEYYYIHSKGQRQPLKLGDWGRGGSIWGGSVGGGTPPSERFFIGTEKQFSKAGPEPPSKPYINNAPIPEEPALQSH